MRIVHIVIREDLSDVVVFERKIDAQRYQEARDDVTQLMVDIDVLDAADAASVIRDENDSAQDFSSSDDTDEAGA